MNQNLVFKTVLTLGTLLSVFFFTNLCGAAIEKKAPAGTTSTQDYQAKWKQVFKLGEVPSPTNKQTVIASLKSSDWFVRDAALQTLSKFSKDEARTWSRKLMSDPSLIVRTTAVQVLADVQTEADRILFWNKLSANENFHAGQSLWIRRHLVRALAIHPSVKEKPKFEALLKDSDPRLYSAAHQALDKIAVNDLCFARSGQRTALGGCDKE